MFPLVKAMFRYTPILKSPCSGKDYLGRFWLLVNTELLIEFGLVSRYVGNDGSPSG